MAVKNSYFKFFVIPEYVETTASFKSEVSWKVTFDQLLQLFLEY